MRTKSLIPDGGIIKVVTLLGALMLFMIVSAAQAKIIYYDNFDGLSGVDLDGTTPDITTGGETWLAGSNFGADIDSTPLAPQNSISGISPNLAYLGKGGYTADPEWAGVVHEFNIYNRALSTSEVLYLASQ